MRGPVATFKIPKEFKPVIDKDVFKNKVGKVDYKVFVGKLNEKAEQLLREYYFLRRSR